MNKKYCKKCGMELPEDYKYKKCEYCRGKAISKVKKRAKKIIISFASVLTLFGIIIRRK